MQGAVAYVVVSTLAKPYRSMSRAIDRHSDKISPVRQNIYSISLAPSDCRRSMNAAGRQHMPGGILRLPADGVGANPSSRMARRACLALAVIDVLGCRTTGDSD